MARTHGKETTQTAVRNPAAILELTKQRLRAVVPDADLRAFSVVFTLIRAADRITHQLETTHRPMGWTWPGFRVLFWIWLLGPLEPRTIASLASASRASISSALNTLERDGFVVRSRGSHDRRLVTVELTARGTEQIVEAFKATNAREREWVAAFTDEEQAVLAELLGRLLDQAGQARHDIDDQSLDD
jgi:DNA-binding MarR family transcriptional regulator